jgi:hypothetical protein
MVSAEQLWTELQQSKGETSEVRNLLTISEHTAARLENALRDLVAATKCVDPLRCAEFYDPQKVGRGLCAHCRAVNALRPHTSWRTR